MFSFFGIVCTYIRAISPGKERERKFFSMPRHNNLPLREDLALRQAQDDTMFILPVFSI